MRQCDAVDRIADRKCGKKNERGIKMSKLEKIVPSLELCKLIPAGEFDDSWLVWGERIGSFSRYSWIKFRDPEDVCYKVPAPTTGEIMAKLVTPSLWRGITGRWYCMCKEHVMVEGGENASEAALRMWLRVKGIEVK